MRPVVRPALVGWRPACLCTWPDDFGGPAVQRPDIERPDIERPDIERPDIERPDIERPDIERVETEAEPRPSRKGATPHARAKPPYSPLGSSTQHWRPKQSCRHRNDFTKADFPRPIWPNTTMLGLVSLPLA